MAYQTRTFHDEVMTGKITPYILVGYIQITLVLGLAETLFDIDVNGSLLLLYLVSFFFITANLAVGVTGLELHPAR